jgi:hypothetical protein
VVREVIEQGTSGMNEAEELAALLEAHDALVRAVIAADIPFAEFVAAYVDFPSRGLDSARAAPDIEAVLRRFRSRIEFHQQVSGLLASVRLGEGMGVAVPAADGFVALAVFRRLQQLVARYPGFRAEPESTGAGTILDEQK